MVYCGGCGESGLMELKEMEAGEFKYYICPSCGYDEFEDEDGDTVNDSIITEMRARAVEDRAADEAGEKEGSE